MYHPSFLLSPTQIHPDADNMVTLDILKEKFGSGWQPTCAELNATEKECKKSWGGLLHKVCCLRRFIVAEMLTLKLRRPQQVHQAPPLLLKSISTPPIISSVDSCAERCRSHSLLSVRSNLRRFVMIYLHP